MSSHALWAVPLVAGALGVIPAGPTTVDGHGDDPPGTATPDLLAVRGLADPPEPVLPLQGVAASVSANVEAGPRGLAAVRGRAPRPGQRPEQVEAVLDLLGVLGLQDPPGESVAFQAGLRPAALGALRSRGHVLAMTSNGVNDGPAPLAADAADRALRGKR
ncbi:hypothetical protein [Allokutzneria oryzae]|uniref:Uncharacterized protein n=1 Tax=Allokutzneria oryzae TaxID=1378989 RepID=A0ABV6A3E0_9PSEU